MGKIREDSKSVFKISIASLGRSERVHLLYYIRFMYTIHIIRARIQLIYGELNRWYHVTFSFEIAGIKIILINVVVVFAFR